MQTLTEQALMPLLNVVTFTLFPGPLSLRRADPSLGLAHGACILASRETYLAVRGHASVRGELFEDQRLAERWRRRGARGLALEGRTVVAVRMYGSLTEIRAGFRKNFYPAFRHTASFWLFLGFHAALATPFFLLPWTRSWPVLASAAMVVTMRGLLAVRFRHPWWTAFVHPVAACVLLGIGLSSWWRCRTGRGVDWKGRLYRSRRPGEVA